jgi:hypothetical protein
MENDPVGIRSARGNVATRRPAGLTVCLDAPLVGGNGRPIGDPATAAECLVVVAGEAAGADVAADGVGFKAEDAGSFAGCDLLVLSLVGDRRTRRRGAGWGLSSVAVGLRLSRLVEGVEAGEDGRLDRAVLVGGALEQRPVVGSDPEHDLPFEAAWAGLAWMHDLCVIARLLAFSQSRAQAAPKMRGTGSCGSRANRYALSVANKPGKVPLPRNVAGLEPGNERRIDRLAPPSAAAQELIAAHLAGHGISPFRLGEHVHLGGQRPASQLISWDPGRASFRCQRCPGRVFHSGEISEAMVERAVVFDQGLQPFLLGLTDQKDRREMARRYLVGDANRERLRQLRGADARRRAARGSRPNVEARRAPVQAWLLARVRELGVLERALDLAEQLQHEDPVAWRELCDRLPSRETMRDWWQDLDPRERQAAFQAGRAGPAKKSTR